MNLFVVVGFILVTICSSFYAIKSNFRDRECKVLSRHTVYEANVCIQIQMFFDKYECNSTHFNTLFCEEGCKKCRTYSYPLNTCVNGSIYNCQNQPPKIPKNGYIRNLYQRGDCTGKLLYYSIFPPHCVQFDLGSGHYHCDHIHKKINIQYYNNSTNCQGTTSRAFNVTNGWCSGHNNEAYVGCN